MKKIILFFLGLFFLASSSNAQSLDERLEKLLGDNLKNYATPLATFTGTYFNSGGYYSASVAKTFGFKISLIGMLIMVPDDQTTFTTSDGAQSATFFGDKGAAVAGSNGFVVYPPGVNVTSIPVGIPQIAASTFGTEVMLRWLPTISSDDIEVKLFGFGIKHSISQYIPLAPVDIAVQLMYNSFSIVSTGTDGADLSTSNIAFNAHASKSFGLFSLYGGLQYESSSLDMEYIYKGDPTGTILTNQRIALELDGDNSFRVTLGFALKLAVLVINADYNIGSQSVLVAGINFEL